jgi:Undecaprenyl-phosphate glucose phosphotransferase
MPCQSLGFRNSARRFRHFHVLRVGTPTGLRKGDESMATKTIDIQVVQRLAKFADLAVLTSGALVLTITHAQPGQPAAFGFFALLVAFTSLIAVRGLGLYVPRAWAKGFMTAFKSFAISGVAGGALYVVSKITPLDISILWVPLWCGLCALHFFSTRLIAQIWVKPAEQAGNFRTRIAFVGGGQAAEDALNLLEQSSTDEFEVLGLFDDRFDNRSPESVRKYKKLGSISDLAPYARAQAIDLIIVAIPLSAETRMLQILKRLWELPVDIRISGAAGKLKLSRGAYTYLGNLPLLSAFERPLSGWDAIMKSLVDRVIALCAIIGLAPIMLAVAAAVKWESKGPVIFKQKRFGFNNELVEVYKFRSMFTDMSDAAAAKLVTKDDPRVTRVGRIIRKTSLDELPQLLNVLLGTLSLVGPRPHATQAKAAGTLYDEVVDGYFARHKVKPGITGWAQINGWRGETDTREKIEQRVKHDLDYIDRWSIGFDLYILAKTPLALLKSENAY